VECDVKKAVRKTDQPIDQTTGTSIPRENLSGAEALAILLLRAESVLGRLEAILPPAQSQDPDWSALARRWSSKMSHSFERLAGY
jgi:hypothetical protein